MEGEGNADFTNPGRWPGEDTRTLHQDVTLARLIKAAEAMEERRLAGAVRPDQSENLALALIKRHIVERDNSAEHNADFANGEQDVALRDCGSAHLRATAGASTATLPAASI